MLAELDDPPGWLLRIATVKYSPDAVRAIKELAYSEPFVIVDSEQCYDEYDEYVACLLLRYQAGAISWATFLYDVGVYSDGNGGNYTCEYFYELLTQLEDNEYGHGLEASQCKEIATEFSEAISKIRPLYDMFMQYFRQFVAQQA